MSEEVLIQYAAPTLAGLKPGNLFTAEYTGKRNMVKEIRRMNRRLVPKGLCLLPLRRQGKRVLVYLFRPALLGKDLSDVRSREILTSYGYRGGTLGQDLSILRKRLLTEEEFPHEIGLFLGYPPEDVRGFIENHAANCKCSGLWKVYGDAERAQHTFRKYRHCTETYQKQWKQGVRFDRLIVPAS